MREWVNLPTGWIESRGLLQFRWGEGGADNVAALMLLAVIAHHSEEFTGVAKVTYDQLGAAANLSRAKISAGLGVLEEREIIERRAGGRSGYALRNYDLKKGWGKLPAVKLYHQGRVLAFDEFRLRNRVELDALKLYFLFVARRDRTTNMAHISYDGIEERTGVARQQIKRALSLLAANGLVHVEHRRSEGLDPRISNAYRLPQIEPYRHMGTYGRMVDIDPTGGAGAGL
jgi:DNA-binding transcriptional ArsR family regulator